MPAQQAGRGSKASSVMPQRTRGCPGDQVAVALGGLGGVGGGCWTPTRALVAILSCCHQPHKRRSLHRLAEDLQAARRTPERRWLLQTCCPGAPWGKGWGGTQSSKNKWLGVLLSREMGRGGTKPRVSSGDEARTLTGPLPGMLWLVAACPRLQLGQRAPDSFAAGGRERARCSPQVHVQCSCQRPASSGERRKWQQHSPPLPGVSRAAGLSVPPAWDVGVWV